jgi:GDPmannose 4,6-dehydratase
MSTAIIFGITGQDGSHLADLLLEKGYNVIGVSRRASTDNTYRLRHLDQNNRFKLVLGDITDSYSVYQILRDTAHVDEIYNLAAQSHVAVSFKQPALTWDITGKGALNILQSIIDLKLNTRYYQASSSEMYGSSYDVDANGEKYQDENTKFLPQSPYAIAKCAAHYMTRLFREAYGLHASSGILFNHEGPRRGETFVTRKITSWLGLYLHSCRINNVDKNEYRDCNRTDSLIFNNFTFPKLRLGNLDAFRDWGYAGDYVEAMWMMLQKDIPDDYVVCTGETHTIREFLQLACEHAGIKDWKSIVTIDPEFYRPAEVDYLRGRNNKARYKLNWTPKTSFEDLVKLMVFRDIHENL